MQADGNEVLRKLEESEDYYQKLKEEIKKNLMMKGKLNQISKVFQQDKEAAGESEADALLRQSHEHMMGLINEQDEAIKKIQ